MNQPSNIVKTCLRWLDSDRYSKENSSPSETFDTFRLIPFVLLHLACLSVFWVGFSTTALTIALGSYFIRMFAITGFYHRYFSHKTFKTSRFWQFLFALLGASAVQRGPLWWAGHHRNHHKHSDQSEDVHSPVHKGFWWSHMGWFCCERNFATPYHRIQDFSRYPELVFLNRYDLLIPLIYALAMYGLGLFLGSDQIGLQITGAQSLVWGFFVSTIVLFHVTSTINSLAHVWGQRRYQTPDNSRNNFWLALLTLGEGWHNNHHHYPASARQGFFWWEADVTWYLLKICSYLGIVWDLKPVPDFVKKNKRSFSH